ncbi:ComF family protein [Limosilactobacillus sp. Lr3000]|uniref:ComF family protein n=2 Tax=Limosilactobacillus albertensis TaxID=2759752 RepID=A0A839H646_9LACO|nr:ComF family protein [Limosilactobacillus albertensis]
MNCLLCNREMPYQITLKDIFSFSEILTPVICDSCKNTFTHWDSDNQCKGCGNGKAEGRLRLCKECQRWQQLYGWHLYHRGLYHYNDAMKNYMQRYKFNGDYRLRLVFQREFSRLVNHSKADIIVPIPISTATMQTRGFNQVVGLLREVQYQTVLQVIVEDKAAQSSKSRKERLETTQPFSLISPEKVVNKRVLLVDDVYTTGRTLYHAASLLKQAGSQWIGSVSLAR